MRRALKIFMAVVAVGACLSAGSSAVAASPDGWAVHSAYPKVAGRAPAGFACSGSFSGGNGNIGGPGAPNVTAVRVGHHGTYDRFVVEFSGTEMPSYKVGHHSTRFVMETRTVKLLGDHGVIVRIFPVNSSSYAGPGRLRPRFAVLREARMVEYFEGHMNWGLGIAGQPCLRVAVYTSPTRLVVDVAR